MCEGTLEDYVSGHMSQFIRNTFASEREILRQVTQGLGHLHNLGIVHRDMKPSNILIHMPDGARWWETEPQVKLADFGISKILQTGKDDFTNTSQTNPSGSKGWMAPEQYNATRFDSKVDIFPLGCIFGYTLSGGKHPFGDSTDLRSSRIQLNEPMLLTQKDLKEQFFKDNAAFELIQSMLTVDPKLRPTVKKIKKSNFFIINSVYHLNSIAIGLI